MGGGSRPGQAPASFALRPPTEADVGWIADACVDPDIQRWTTVPSPYGIDDARVFVASGGGSLLVRAVVEVDPSTGEEASRGVGMVAVHRIDEEVGDAALGYWVAPWARRRGVAAWATLAIAVEAVERWGVRQVSLDIADTNAASRGVARRAGFSRGNTPPGLCVPDGDGETPATRWVLAVG